MCCWRRIEKIKTNEQALERIGEKRTLLNNILGRKANCIGHIKKKLTSSQCDRRIDDGSERSRKKKNTTP